MKSNQKILDEFGKLVGTEGFDSSYGSIVEILNGTCPNLMKKDLIRIFNKLDNLEKNKIKIYIYELISGTLFNFLKIFEENEQFKLYYENENQKVNLLEISEMLKAEPIIEGGWIERFSEELKKEVEE